MKRVFEVSADTKTVRIKITGKIEVQPGELVTGEVETLRDNLADAAMRALANAPYVQAPLNRIKAK